MTWAAKYIGIRELTCLDVAATPVGYKLLADSWSCEP